VTSKRPGQAVRVITVVITAVLIPVYGFIVLVALIMSGDELIRQPLAWYAGLAPLVYLAFCLTTAAGLVDPARVDRRLALAVHLAAAPLIFLSFMGVGLVLPVVAVLWYLMYRRIQIQTHSERSVSLTGE